MISLGAIIGTGMLAQSIEYKEGVGLKQFAWLLHTGTMGAMLAPMCFLGGPLLIRAAWLTAGVVGGLSAVAVSIFLNPWYSALFDMSCQSMFAFIRLNKPNLRSE